jgi:Ca2+-binding RTX toxin-like protein
MLQRRRQVDETAAPAPTCSARSPSTPANGTTVKGEVEHLTLTGTGAINGTGNALDNIIVGNNGANKLDGGLGADTLSGGLGADTVTGGGGDDQIDAVDGNDTVRFTRLDCRDAIANFDGNATRAARTPSISTPCSTS